MHEGGLGRKKNVLFCLLALFECLIALWWSLGKLLDGIWKHFWVSGVTVFGILARALVRARVCACVRAFGGRL